MTNVNHYWPETLQPSLMLPDSLDGGVRASSYDSGSENLRTFYDHELLTVELQVFMQPNDTNYVEHYLWLKWIASGANKFWWRHPHKNYNIERPIGIGDGTRTTWSIPFYDPTGLEVYKDGKRYATHTFWYDGPNILSKAESLADYDQYTSGGGATAGTYTRNRPVDWLFTNDIMEYTGATGTDSYVIQVTNPITMAGPVTRKMTAHVNGKVIGTTKLGAVLLLVDTGGSYNWFYSTPVTGSTAGYTWVSVTDQITSVGSILPFCGPGLQAASPAGKAIYNGVALCHGDLPEWWCGNVDLPVVEFDTAPSAGEVISASAFELNLVHYMRCTSWNIERFADGTIAGSCTLKETSRAT